MSRSPLVSVLMPMRDAAAYVRVAIASVLSQSLPDFELLVIDDDSRDDSVALVSALAATDNRIRLLRNSEPLGVARSLNRALGEARGTLIARMDSDDFAMGDRFRRQVEYLTQHPEVSVVGSTFEVIGAEGRHIGYGQPYSDPFRIAWELHFDNPISHPSVMMRRGSLEAANGYDAEVRESEDYHLWVRLSQTTQIANISEPLVKYRLHPRQATAERKYQLLRWSDWNRGLALSSSLGETVPMHVVDWWSKAMRGEQLESQDAFNSVIDLLFRMTVACARKWQHTMSDTQLLSSWATSKFPDLARVHANAFPDAVRAVGRGVLPATPLIGSLTAFKASAPPLELDGCRGKIFVHHPQWGLSNWSEVVRAYATAFQPTDDVTLVLWLDPKQAVSQQDATASVIRVLEESAIAPANAPDIMLFTEDLTSVDIARLYMAADWVVPHGDLIQASHATQYGARLLTDIVPASWRAAAASERRVRAA